MTRNLKSIHDFFQKSLNTQAVKLRRKTSFSKAAKELGINIDTLYDWNKCAKEAWSDLGQRTQTLDTAITLTEKIQKFKQQNTDLAKESACLNEKNEFLTEASIFSQWAVGSQRKPENGIYR